MAEKRSIDRENYDALTYFYDNTNIWRIHHDNPERYESLLARMNRLKGLGFDAAPEMIGRYTKRSEGRIQEFPTDKGNTAITLIPVDMLDKIPKGYIFNEDMFSAHVGSSSPYHRLHKIPKNKKKTKKKASGGSVKKLYKNTTRKANY